MAQRFFHGIQSNLPLQGGRASLLPLGGIAGSEALATLHARKHHALDIARMQAHGASVVAGAATGAVASTAFTGPVSGERDDHALGVGHPGQALKQAHRAAKSAKQVPRQGELQREDQRAYRQKPHLVGGERAVPEIAPDFGWWQQVSEQGDRPGKATDEASGQKKRPPARVGLACGVGGGGVVPDAELARCAVQQVVQSFHHRKVGAQPAAIQATIAVGNAQESGDQTQGGQKAAPKNGPARLHCRGFAAQEGINAQRPAHAKNPQLRFVEIEAQKVQSRSQQEKHHEGALQPPSAALKGNPAPQRMQSGRRCVALRGSAAGRLGFSPHHPPPHAPPHPVR